MTAKRFPIMWPSRHTVRTELERLGCPKSIPWAAIEPHEAQALRNHDQTLARLAERGGLDPVEAAAVLDGVAWRDIGTLTLEASVTRLRGVCDA